MASLTMGFNHVYGPRHESLMWSKPQMQLREWLVTPIKVLPLLQQWAHLAQQVGIAAFRVQNWVAL